ncbi:MAG: TetR/AcrR family transcriptional regulator [Acetobacterium woodii]|nr:TetR/AcrR family transcriptional regulator [Acetobacterium woodii]
MQEHVNQRTLQAMRTKKKIFNTSVTLINERGFENVTVDDICKACGLSKGAFYHHFNSKLDIISGIETMLNASINEAMEECEDVKIRTRVLVFTNSLLSIVDKTGLEFTRQRTKYVVGGDYINEKESDTFSNYSRLKLKEMLDTAVEKGELAEKTPVSIVTEMIMTLLSGLIADWCIFNGAYSLTDKGWELTEFAVANMVDKYCV